MTAPLDIGLELQDASLHHGQEDVFDLEHTARSLRKAGGLSRIADKEDEESDSEEEDNGDETEDDEVLDEEEERARKVKELEMEMDGMYDAYQDRLKERDAKYKVKEARRLNKEREEWNGIQKDSDEEGESDEDGGWDLVQANKAKAGEDSDSESDIDDDDDASPQPSKKRRREANVEEPASRKKARVAPGAAAKSDVKLSRNAQVWFDQDLFNGVGLSDVEDDEDEEVEEDDESEEDEASGSEAEQSVSV